MAVGKELQRIRQANPTGDRPMSRAKLAAFIGVPEDRLRKWEDNDTNPKPADSKKIEEYFHVGLNELSTIGKFEFYTKEVTNVITDDSPIVFENQNLSKIIGEIMQRQIRTDAVHTVLIQDVAEIKVKIKKLLKEPETSISREVLELLKTVDGETDRLLVELRKKS